MESHEAEKLEDIIFNIKVLRYAKTAFERQIYESVLIQENTGHKLLNSKSEYNRCAISRLTLKIGDKETKEEVDRRKEEQKKEEEIDEKVRGLRKQKNRQRKQRNRQRKQRNRGHPKRKKQKLDPELEMISSNLPEAIPDCVMISKSEKRLEKFDGNPRPKKQRTLGEYLYLKTGKEDTGGLKVIPDCDVPDCDRDDQDAATAKVNQQQIMCVNVCQSRSEMQPKVIQDCDSEVLEVRMSSKIV